MDNHVFVAAAITNTTNSSAHFLQKGNLTLTGEALFQVLYEGGLGTSVIIIFNFYLCVSLLFYGYGNKLLALFKDVETTFLLPIF